ncbi:MAG: WD40/YVTN/BNR-like repeat-containing protein [Fimbriimonas sp.]
MLAPAASPAGPVELIVGSPSLKIEAIAKVAGQLGRLTSLTGTGLYRLTLKDGLTAQNAKLALKKKGLDYVFSTETLRVDPNSLKSVEQHIEMKRASAKILRKTAEEVGVDFYEALEFYLKPRVDENGLLPRDAYERGARQRARMPIARVGKKQNGVGALKVATGANWMFMGPQGLDVPYRQYYGVATISGRKNDVVYAKSAPSTMYAASAGGGVWKSTDGGTNWLPKSDGWKFLHSSTVAVSPTDANLVLAGTGDYVGFFSAQTFGIMRSTDGGATWTNVGVAELSDKIVSKIAFDPDDPNIVLATAGRGVTAGDIYRSIDGGQSWTRTGALDGSWDTVNYSPLEISPGVRRAWACGGGTASGTKIAYSDDRGVTWTMVANPVGFTTVEQNLHVAASANDPDGVYVIGPINQRVYKSMNGGAAWTEITAGLNADWSQSDYDNFVTVGKNGANDVVYIGLISVHASPNGGSTWADIGLTATASAKWHNDQHSMTLHPTNPNEGFVCADGGLAQVVYNPAGNSATFTMKNASFGDEQFYSLALHPTNLGFIMGGTQDNATPASRNNLAAWKNLYAGDGGFAGFNKASPGTHYTTAQGGSVYRYDSDLDTTPVGVTPTGASVFVTPLAMGNSGYTDPFTVTGNKLRRLSANRWTASKTTLSSNAERVVVSSLNGQRIFTCHANGDIYMSTNNGSTLVKIDGNLPAFAIGSVCESRFTNYDMVAVIQTTDASVGRVYRCANVNVASPVWTDISGSGITGLPKVPFNCVTRDPYDANTIYAGSDIGAFMSTDGGATWSNMNGLGLPNVHVNELVVSNDKTWLYAATFGRGIWRIGLSL